MQLLALPIACGADSKARARARTAAVVLSVPLCILSLHATAAQAQNPPVTISVDANVNRRPIDPNIYGVAHASTAELTDLNSPLNRNGGNNTTRYNWQLNADNRGNDWYYQSIADSSATAGERGDTFISRSRAANASAMLTVPTIEWVAKVGPNRSKLASFSVAKYGAQTGTDWQWFPDAGNGVRTNGQFVTGNDPNDANVPSTSLFQQGWVQHLVGRWGTNANGGLRYYILDNEPSIWHSTHRDVRPTSPTMAEIRDKTLDFAPEDQGDRSHRARRRARGVGLERILLQRLRSAVRQHARMGLASRSRQPGRRGLPAVVPRPDAAAPHDVRPAPPRRLHRPLLPAGRRVQRRRVERDAAPAEPLDPIALGSELRRRDVDQRPGPARATRSGTGSTPTIRARRSGSRNTTGAPRITSTARRHRRTSTGSSAARGSTWARAGRRPPRARRPTRR